MARLSAQQFVQLLDMSQLVPREQLLALLSRLRENHGGQLPADGDAMAREFISARLLTEWQVNKLKTGKYKGFRLGKYRLLDHLGSGGMGSVYLAEHSRMNRQVALKVLPRHRVKDRSYLERFYLEAQAVAALDHPNIVRAFDVDCEGDLHYLVMEYVAGSDLKTLVTSAERPLHFAVAADYVAQAARGLQHAHESGLIHRDVKPANLLVDKSGRVKLLDLGLARFQQQPGGSLTVTHQEQVLGTADYLAPEQALDSHNADARADIYSLGCTLYFALTGQPPFAEGTLAQRIADHQSREPPGIRKWRPECPEQLANICQRMLCKDPAERYQTAAEVASALDEWRKKSRLPLPAPEPIPDIVIDAARSDPKVTAPHRDATLTSNAARAAAFPSATLSRTDAPPMALEETEQIQLIVPQLVSHRTLYRERCATAKKPPITLWIGLGILTAVALGLSFYVFFSQ